MIFVIMLLEVFDIESTWPQVIHFFETYVFADWQFLTFFLILQMMDTFLLLYKAVVAKSVSMGLIGIIFQKILIYICFLVLVHILANYTIEGERNSFFGWFTTVAYSAVMVRESISILENIGSIRPDLIPRWILKRLKQYDKTGEFEPKEAKKIAK
jgi:phage-related holin